MGRILALDIGGKRVGLAISDELKMIASPLRYVGAKELEVVVKAEIEKYEIDKLVVGFPRNMDGSEGSLAGYVRDIAEKLRKIVGAKAEVVLADETLTSVEAEKRLKERKKDYQKGDIDAEAAAVILENYLKEKYAE